MLEIGINEIENVRIGNAQDFKAATGCTVIICEKGAPTGIDIRGGAPASRETELLNPLKAAEKIHAVLLSGGSAFGLDASGGVMQYLEEKQIGFDVGITKVPLVCQSSIFDLIVGSKDIRPDKKMGYEACKDSEKNNPKQGNYGAGTGATVGKFYGTDYMMKSGLGFYAIRTGDLKVGAVVVVNALGDVYDLDSGKIIAGLLNKEKNGFLNTKNEMYKSYEIKRDLFSGNTTIGIIITNACFNKTQMNKIAAMAQNGYAKTICPVHTSVDGDSIYAMSTGEVSADINIVGTIASEVMAKAINNAVKNADSIYGLKSYSQLNS